MSIEKLIKDRRTIHSYASGKIEENILQQALQLASYAPNHRLTFPWVFVDVGPESRKFLAKIEAQMKAEKTGMDFNILLNSSLRKFLDPAHLLLVGIKKSEDAETQKEDYATLSASLQNMSLYLWDKKIGTKWSTGKITKSAVAYKIADLDPNEYELCGFFWIGIPSKIPEAAKRPPVSSFFKIVE